jgi:hypothetical protein
MALEDFSKYANITVNPKLPKNEKDLICALLAGRLRDLFNGKLFCLNLAIDDLIKDASGYGLDDLKGALSDLKGALDDFKSQSGYDKVLAEVNAALGQVGNVFSLGGLCPSPITPPKIPDVLAGVSKNLFGQGMSIINSLGKVANPTMCFGAGPGGFGMNYNSMDGSLASLKRSLNNFANDPGGLQAAASSFSNSLKMQERRLKSELKRLQNNLSDPFGLNKAKQRANSLKNIHKQSASYKVVDKYGVTHDNVTQSLVPNDTYHLLTINDNTPIIYNRVAVLNHCCEEVGIQIMPVSGDATLAGWDTNPATDNSDRPFGQHQLPETPDAEYDFVIREINGNVIAYKSDGVDISPVYTIELERGISYRFLFDLSTISAKVNTVDNQSWFAGLEFSQQTTAGLVIIEDPVEMLTGELDWGVRVEDPTTPNSLKFKYSNGTSTPITVTGLTRVPNEFRTYDLGDVIYKALFFKKEEATVLLDGTSVNTLVDRTGLIYSYSSTVNSTTVSGTASYNTNAANNTYRVTDVTEDVYNKAFELYTSTSIYKLFLGDNDGVAIGKLIISTADDDSVVEFTEPINLSSETRLPYTDLYDYRMVLRGENYVVSGGEMSVDYINDNLIRMYLTDVRGTLSSGQIFGYYDIDITNKNSPMLTQCVIRYLQNDNSYQLVFTKIN